MSRLSLVLRRAGTADLAATQVDVWTTNAGLHDYYRREGFQFCGLSPLRGYPSAALFQKPTLGIQPPADPLFCVAADG